MPVIRPDYNVSDKLFREFVNRLTLRLFSNEQFHKYSVSRNRFDFTEEYAVSKPLWHL